MSMIDVFFSYARADKPRVQTLVERCKAEGWTVWWDHALHSGEEFAFAIDENLRSAKCVVVCWSKNSSGSRWVRDEADVAVGRGVAVPVSLDGSQPPIGFGQFHTPDVSRLVGDTGADLSDFIQNVRATIDGGRAVALASSILGRRKRWSSTSLVVTSLLTIVALVIAATFSVFAVQKWSEPTAPTKFSKLAKAEILMSEIDDFMTIVVNDVATYRSQFGEATDWIDVTRHFKRGPNKVSLTIVNGQYGGCGGRLELRMNGYVAPEHRWAYGTATGNTEGKLPNVMCYAQVKTIVLD
jgi:hypothetical protein